jgi:hypothetical protein
LEEVRVRDLAQQMRHRVGCGYGREIAVAEVQVLLYAHQGCVLLESAVLRLYGLEVLLTL